MTAFFALTTAGCLIGLAVFTARMDSDARERVDADLLTHADYIAQGIELDADGQILTKGPPPTANLAPATGLAAIGSAAVAIVDGHGVTYASPASSWLPTSSTISDAYEQSQASSSSVFFTAQGHDRATYRWVALPLDRSPSAITIVGTSAASPIDHSTVVSGLVAAVAGLVVLATLVGHALAALAMRPAIRQLELQEQFLREAAHELRTPLATLALTVEAGLSHPETASAALRAVSERVSGIDFIVDSLLARARAESSDTDVQLRTLRLDQLVEVTVDDLHARDRIDLDVKTAIVSGNADLLGQAVRNLVENALRHAPGSRVHVDVDDHRLTVTDSGPAGPDTLQALPAVDNHDSASSPPRTRGTGTGLSIVTWVADLHDADLTFEGTPEGGMRVDLVFPATQPVSPATR